MASNTLPSDNSAENKTVFFEDVLEQCCGTGLWQGLLIGYLSIMWLIFPTLAIGMMFVGATPKFKCADGFDSNATFTDLPDNTPRCHALNSTSENCSRWVYDQSVYLSTVVTEWDLVCARKPLLSMLQSWLMIGGIVGAIPSGHLADKFGRRLVFLPAMLLVMVCALSAALTTNYTVFAALRFFTGIAMASMVGKTTLLIMEMTSIKRRAMVGVCFYIPYAFGICLVAAFSYAIRTRWLLQLAYAVLFLLLVPIIWLLPESPRWLVHQERFKEAFHVLKTAARWNRKQMPPEQEVFQLMSQAHKDMLARKIVSNTSGTKSDSLFIHLFHLIETPQMRRNTFTMAFVFFVISGSYFGLSFDTTQLSPSPHLAATPSGLAELPSYSFYPVLNRFGRRPSIVAFMTFTGVAMLLVLTKQDTTLWLVLGLLAKIGITFAFCIICVQAPECMPTQLRGLAMGVFQMAVRLGAAFSPFVVDLVSELDPAAPSGVFGGFVLLAAMSCLLLPETKGRPMPETVADVESWSSAKQRTCNGDAAEEKGSPTFEAKHGDAGTSNAEKVP